MKKLLLLLLIFVLTGCIHNEILGGNGENEEKKISTITDINYNFTFKNISTDQKSVKLNFIQGTEKTIAIRGDKNILDTINLTVNNNNITIEGKRNIKYRPTKNIEVDIVNVNINELNLQGVIDINDQVNFFYQDLILNIDGVIGGSFNLSKVTNKLKIEINGVISIDFNNINLKELTFNSDGTNTNNLRGSADKFTYIAKGVNTLLSKDLVVKTTYIDIEGVCNAVVYATDILNIEASGVGSVRYLGNPELAKSIQGMTFTVDKYIE